MDIVGESIKFMVLGMLVVFTFLYVLVVLMGFQAKIIKKFFPEKKQPIASSASSTASGGTAEDESRRIAAIIAAVSEFRKN
ncbi:MAG TPA: Na+-transporting oxaloacetate decarboxylase subunit gamma [Sulfurovum sp. UBA12169]|nr:MAG TPA: Na+-transporting oxaloacetate decarboxylase subunit gamma [Sulfurovum sp. UBA12169]